MVRSRRRADLIADLRRAILETAGATRTVDREAAAGETDTSGPAEGYLHKVRHEAHRIVDADLAPLRAAGLSDDAILELTLAAAFGAATRRYERGLRALERVRGTR